jgi:hypothetical protein
MYKQEVNQCLQKLNQLGIIFRKHMYMQDSYQILQRNQIIGFLRLEKYHITEMSLFLYGGFHMKKDHTIQVNGCVTKDERVAAEGNQYTIFGETYSFSDSLEDIRYDCIVQKKMIVVVAMYYYAIRFFQDIFKERLESFPWHVLLAFIDKHGHGKEYHMKYTTAVEGMCNSPHQISCLTISS